jgi:hypothetical protein
MATDDRYPRGLPYQPPPGKPPVGAGPWTTRLTHPNLVLAATAVLFLVIGIGVGVFLANSGKETPKERMVETLGVLCHSHLYQSYLNINLIAELVEKEVWDEDEANDMLNLVIDKLGTVDKRLDNQAQLDLSEEDKDVVEGIRLISARLKTEVAALRAYWLEPDRERADRFNATRRATYAALSEFLGLPG